MGFIDKNLQGDERIIYRAYRHWVLFVLPVSLFIAGGLVLYQLELGFVSWAAAVVFLFPAIKLCQALVKYIGSEFTITSKRVLMKTGIFRRSVYEIPHSKVAGVGFTQNIIGSMLNFGSLVIASTGETRESFQTVAAPAQFTKEALALSSGVPL